jgi:hypothetical protein
VDNGDITVAIGNISALTGNVFSPGVLTETFNWGNPYGPPAAIAPGLIGSVYGNNGVGMTSPDEWALIHIDGRGDFVIPCYAAIVKP